MTHEPESAWPISKNALLINGVPLTRLAERVGQTPFYAYDRSRIEQKIALLRQAMPKALRLHYAIKANPMPALVQWIAARVDGLDVASLRELHTALDTGQSPQNIGFAGPGKREAEIHCAVAAGVCVHIESALQLAFALRAGEALGLAPRLSLRLNPNFELKSSGMKMGGGAKPFGVDVEQAPAILKTLVASGAEFVGFHLYAGSQNLRAEAIVEAQQLSFECIARLSAGLPVAPELLNLGGGFGIPYFPGERPLSLAPISENLHELVQKAKALWPHASLALELGRYLVGEAGLYVCRVVDRKVSRDQVFLVTDGGMHHHLAASGNLGQVLRKNYPIVIGTRMDSPELETASVVGPLCTPLDLLADRMLLPKANVGDLVAVLQSGAYGLSASPTRFLSQPEALEVFV